MNIYFYDNFSSSYNRFGNNVSNKLIKKRENVNIFYIHDNYDNGKISLNNDMKKAITILKNNEVKKYISKYKPDVFVSFSFRIPDVYWTYYFNSLSVKTIQVQHGLYIEHYKRNIKFLLTEVSRSLSYIFYLLRLSFRVEKKVSMLANLLKKDFKIFNVKGDVDRDIASDTLIVWGEYWKGWYKRFLYYDNSSDFEICGSFDFELLENEENKIKTEGKATTYICQTLVEDGRLSKDEFDIFLNRLMEFVENYDGILFIKLHPRSKREYYQAFEEKNNVVLTNKFPVSDYYIGHSSTLLSVCAYLEKKVLLVEFSEHQAPKIFKKICGGIIHHSDFIKFDSVKKSDSKATEYYCKFIKDPFGKIAEVILKNATMTS